MDGLAVLDEIKKIDDDLAGHHDHRVRLGRDRDRGDEAPARSTTSPSRSRTTRCWSSSATRSSARSSSPRTARSGRTSRSATSKFGNIIGRSQRMRQVFDLIIQAAPSRSTILIQGESGTGKELVARAIHTNSPRADRAFVTVNSGNLPPDLLESNLFGHVKGAFTGAVYPKKGLFELADRGTHLLRRDRQHPARDPAQAAARDAGARVHAAGRRREHQGGRADRRGDQRRPAPDDGGSSASARTSTTACTSSPCSCRRCASARRTSRCWCSTSSTSTATRTRSRASS